MYRDTLHRVAQASAHHWSTKLTVVISNAWGGGLQRSDQIPWQNAPHAVNTWIRYDGHVLVMCMFMLGMVAEFRHVHASHIESDCM